MIANEWRNNCVLKTFTFSSVKQGNEVLSENSWTHFLKKDFSFNYDHIITILAISPPFHNVSFISCIHFLYRLSLLSLHVSVIYLIWHIWLAFLLFIYLNVYTTILLSINRLKRLASLIWFLRECQDKIYFLHYSLKVIMYENRYIKWWRHNGAYTKNKLWNDLLYFDREDCAYSGESSLAMCPIRFSHLQSE